MNNTFKKDKARVSLYYEKYKFKGTICIPGIEWFRYIKTIDDYQKKLESSINTYLLNRIVSSNKTITIRKYLEENHPGSLERIKDFILWRSFLDKFDVKLVITFGRVYVYSNEEEVFSNLLFSELNYVESIPNWEKGVIYHKNPKNKWRIYFKHTRLNESEAKAFIEFLERYSFIPSYSLQRLLYPKNGRTLLWNTITAINYKKVQPIYLRDIHYVDFDDEVLTTIIGVGYGTMIKRVSKIEKIEEA